ncbi:flagellar type III secretion system pore protein FliP [Desulfosporosinus acidiphilus]|uniref:flagellar type III secretion system pore protein FliP n=1 Tax=Desulfosporosinus acidiphilus TaxID=885581 RepID=UPI001FA7E672|nr:flagellar type III secretion system pore protein FliP [Desulfosporosinus acidiphilus]
MPLFLAVAFLILATPKSVFAAGVTLDLGNSTSQQLSTSLQLLMTLTVLSVAPAILLLMTSFTRIVIVLSFVRNALGTQQLPPNQVLVGLALFLSFFVMAPTWNQINTNAIQPYMKNQITQTEALTKAEEPLRDFMFKQTREKDLELFVGLAKMERPKTYRDIPTYVLIPAFVISELKTAFQMGFAIFIPFMVIDMIVSSTLMSIGMMMLPPMMISLPFKILLFVLVDGWHLVVQSLVTSFK